VSAVLLALWTQEDFESGRNPDLLTYVVFAFSCIWLSFFAFYTFDAARIRARMEAAASRPPVRAVGAAERLTPKRMSSLLGPQTPPRSLDDIGKTLAALAATFISQPLLFGFILFTVSGDLWRQLLFAPLAALAAALYWRRIESALASLRDSGLT
jgi:hypothetical protein